MNRRKSPMPLQDEISVEKPLRIAMWSGPRNVSTALLRAWGNRADTFVCDEPFYAHYLRETGAPHPGADEVISGQENDWQKVVEFLLGPVPTGDAIFYQKHMAHHLLPNMGRVHNPDPSKRLLFDGPRPVQHLARRKLVNE